MVGPHGSNWDCSSLPTFIPGNLSRTMRAAASLSYGHPEDRTPTNGYEPTAMAAFAKSWRRE
jgi:hypothetical protein